MKKQGTARMMEQGKTASTIWMTPGERKVLQQAADFDGRKLASFIKRMALLAAERFVKLAEDQA